MPVNAITRQSLYPKSDLCKDDLLTLQSMLVEIGEYIVILQNQLTALEGYRTGALTIINNNNQRHENSNRRVGLSKNS